MTHKVLLFRAENEKIKGIMDEQLNRLSIQKMIEAKTWYGKGQPGFPINWHDANELKNNKCSHRIDKIWWEELCLYGEISILYNVTCDIDRSLLPHIQNPAHTVTFLPRMTCVMTADGKHIERIIELRTFDWFSVDNNTVVDSAKTILNYIEKVH